MEHLGGDPAWQAFGFVLSFNECNLEGGADLETLWSFTSVSSDFYPGLASHYSQLIDDWYAARESNDGEALIRHTLAIDEESYGSEHPKVATDLYTLGRLLKDEERFDEAEPLMRRALIIHLKLARKSAQRHRVSWLIAANYRDLLKQMLFDDQEIEKRLDQMRLETWT